MKKNKLVVQSSKEVNVTEEISAMVQKEIEQIVDKLSETYKRNIKVSISIELD